jgi:hypothetical protein
MNDDRLEQLLRTSGADEQSPHVAADEFARRLIAIDRRRTHLRRAVSSVLALFVIAVTTFALPHSHRSNTTIAHHSDQPAASPDFSRELAALDRDASLHEQVIACLDRHHRDESKRIAPAPLPDVLTLIAVERERAAMLLIQQGDWQTPRNTIAARHEYRRACDLFPDTFSANIARDRLEKLDSRKDG